MALKLGREAMSRASAAVSNETFGNRQELQMLSILKLPSLLAKFKMCGSIGFSRCFEVIFRRAVEAINDQFS